MSTFTVIMLAIVAYFAVGGVIMGLIDEAILYDDVLFWPVHVLVWLTEVMVDLGYALKGVANSWRFIKND